MGMGQLAAPDNYDAFAIDPMSGMPLTPGADAQGLFNRAANAIVGGAQQTIEAPGKLTEPNPYPPGSEEANWYEDQRAKLGTDFGASTALNLMGIGAPLAMTGVVPKGAVAGLFGGRLAETADLGALRQAKTMQKSGADPSAILDTTGWEKRPDRQWRFEINDRDAAMQPAPFANMRMNEPLPGATKPDVTASDVMTHPELYAAYPDLADAPVRRLPAVDQFGQPNNIRGGYAPEQGAFYLRENLPPDEARTVLLHEMQHAIQEREKFASGGNVSNPAVVKRGDQQLEQTISAAEQRFGQLRDRMQAEASARSPTGELTPAAIKQWKNENPEAAVEMDRLFGTFSGGGALRSQSRFEAYRALQGETEARNVAARADLIPEQRFLLRPEVTEDVARGAQWVARDRPKKIGDIAAQDTLPLDMMQDAGPVRRYTALGGEVNAGVDAPARPRTQTVLDPYRMMYPGIYANPREIAAQAASRVIPENPAMQQLWGVSRGDLDAMAAGRVGTEAPQGVIPSQRGRGSLAAQNIMIPRNEQRLTDILGEGGKYPGLAHADAWYVMDPVYQRLEQMFGPAEAVQRYRHLNTMTGMASPGSDVLTELQRGTAAHWLQQQGRFEDFTKFGGVKEANRGADFPADLRYLGAHPYHSTSQAGPMGSYIERGALMSESPKVPLYVHASGVPQTGFQTTAPVGDAHFSRGVGLADTRKGPTDVGASFSRSEYETMAPWWREKVAAPVGLESVPAQARLWTILGPQTGVDSPLGQGKLELFSQQIVKAAQRLGVSPETARDLILSGGAGAGMLTMAAPGFSSLASQNNYQQ